MMVSEISFFPISWTTSFPENLLVPVSPFPLMQFQVRFTDIFGANKSKNHDEIKIKLSEHYNIHRI